MENVYTCAERYYARKIRSALELPTYSCPQLYSTQQSKLFPYIEMSRFRRVDARWTAALSEIHLRIHEKVIKMPPTKRSQYASRDGMPEMIQFRLSDEELLEFDRWIERKEFAFDTAFEEALLSDHKIGVSWDANNNCFIATFTAKGDRHLNAGKCLMSRAMDWREAVALNLFKCEVTFNKDRGRWSNRNGEDVRG